MSEIFHGWIMRLTGAAILSGCAMALTPETKAKKAVRILCACITFIAFLYPMTGIQFSGVEDVFSEYREEAQTVSLEIAAVNEKIEMDIIEKETAEYILDKGLDIGLEIKDVQVRLEKRSDGKFYPYCAEVKGYGEGEKIQLLKNTICSELGIAADKIYWRDIM